MFTCDEIKHIIPESASINPSSGINYWLIVVVLLEIACLMLLETTIIK